MTAAEQLAFNMPVAGLTKVDLAWANVLLTRWGHNLGPVNRPFRSEAWALEIEGTAVAVAVSASIVSEHVSGTDHSECGRTCQLAEWGWRGAKCGTPVRFSRNESVECARLCSDPAQNWATRPMIRLWREVAAPRWACWPLTTAVSYSQNQRHDGNLYRFDGWTKIADDCGSSGGGAWSRKRYATDAVHGKKSLWIWQYEGAAS